MILDEILAHKRAEVAERKRSRPLEALQAAIAARGETVAVVAPRAARGEAASGHAASEVRREADAAGAISAARGEAEAAGAASATQREVEAHQAITAGRIDPTGFGNSFPHGGSAILSRAKDRAFGAALRQPGVSFIAEIKRKSPSGGELRAGASAEALARIYANTGAAALSVLTDERYFGGSDADLIDASAASGLPVLRKDFVVDAYQIYEARAIGADAVLLIVRALSDVELGNLLALTHNLGMEALVEAHSAPEVERALQGGARIIGVNNRDLDTLVTDVTLAPRLRPMVPPECLFVAESGISQPDQIGVLRDAGVDAVLIGESLLRSPDPGEKLRALVAAGLVHA